MKRTTAEKIAAHTPTTDKHSLNAALADIQRAQSYKNNPDQARQYLAQAAARLIAILDLPPESMMVLPD